ncbi:MAG: type II toxin-antitoxin system PemK/MazF family toxin [Candidatus Pacebacteria bacterium]|nr:type II toxin-antitoxin system PemK/MazF family toxin [Candidatus Paceibacterota bacterium]
MKQGEIWMVNFNPSKGHEFQKERPAIIISSNKIIKLSNLITVLPITSNTNNCLDDDIKIIKDSDNHLFMDSIVKVTHISSFDKNNSRFVKKIGVVNEYILQQIKKYLIKHFDMISLDF